VHILHQGGQGREGQLIGWIVMANIRRRSRADRRQAEGEAPGTERRAPGARDLRVRMVRRSDTHVVLYLSHEFVDHNHHMLDEALERLSPHQPGLRVEVDLSHVPYADSDALSRLMVWSKRLRQAGAELVVVNPPPYVMSIIEVLRLDTFLSVIHRHTYPQHEE
jgi:anti-anti-sigma factor